MRGCPIRWRAKANADFDEAIRLNPKLATAYNNRAWILATCPSADCRNGAKAIEDATKACELGGWNSASLFATLAAAYAEAGTLPPMMRQRCGHMGENFRETSMIA